MGRAEAELSILVTDDSGIRDLNRDFRGRDVPTDVLSFPQLEGEPMGGGEGPDMIGDVAISRERVQVQAEEFGVQAEVEWDRLLTHGILHLLGYDHEGSEDEAEFMRELEERYVPSRENDEE